ncbi:MAG TPA: hypothetical protein VEP91_00465 [Solirubrobacterales bacterium]|nr:hypothetical protein [Solirubrobacterales bacterium]
MRLILASNHLGLGGSESYLLTVAEQLERLGHDTTLYARELGAGADLARSRGFRVVEEGRLPDDCDAALVQDAGVSLDLAARYQGARQVFIAHSETLDLQLPPQLEGLVSAVVALNDRVAERLRALAIPAPVMRLRQPIDTERFVPGAPLPERPRRALLLSNNAVADRLAMLKFACAAAGMELVRVGGEAGQTSDPRNQLVEADVVIGYGRSILEAMACGRAAYVYDRNGSDGWVTADSYGEIEAGGFAGRSGWMIADRRTLEADLARFDPAMGPVNHDLVIVHHRANVHAQELVELIETARGRAPVPRGPLEEMARLVRMEWRARVDAQALVGEQARLQAERHRLERRVEEVREEAAARTAAAFRGTLSWRLTKPIRSVGRLLARLGIGR